MLGSVGFGELLLIAIIALVVFGPHRLPEIARRAGKLMAQARKATQELTDALDAEYDGATSPIRDLQSEYEATRRQITDSAAKITGTMASQPSSPSDLTGADPTDETPAHPPAETIGVHPDGASVGPRGDDADERDVGRTVPDEGATAPDGADPAAADPPGQPGSGAS
jgi:Tat protein translocase TatB subunit